MIGLDEARLLLLAEANALIRRAPGAKPSPANAPVEILLIAGTAICAA